MWIVPMHFFQIKLDHLLRYMSTKPEPVNLADFIFSENWKKEKLLSMFLCQSFVLHQSKIDHMFLEALN